MKEVAFMPKAISLASLAFTRSDTLCRAHNGRIYFAALCIASSALHVALKQMMIHGIEDDLRNLRAGSIVKEDESGSAIQRWKSVPNVRNGKAGGR